MLQMCFGPNMTAGSPAYDVGVALEPGCKGELLFAVMHLKRL